MADSVSAAARPLPPLLLRGDCLVRLRDLPDDSIDAVVTDPPYGLDFMGKDWDNAVKLANGMLGQIAAGLEKSDRGPLARGGTHSQGYKNHDGLAFELWVTTWAAECLRVLKPGGHLLAFGGSRTWHRLAAGIEDAGFEMRDSIAWLYGSGFPKSLDVSKAIDKAAGAERKVVGRTATPYKVDAAASRGTSLQGSVNGDFSKQADAEGYRYTEHTAPATPDAAAWQGWGTALKPAFEPIVVARKPLAKGRTVAANVLQYGTGALNIDASRIGHDEPGGRPSTGMHGKSSGIMGATVERHRETTSASTAGRWPANVVLDESQAAALDVQAPKTGAATIARAAKAYPVTRDAYGASADVAPFGHDERGGASRFFYVAKAPKSERPVVVDEITGERTAHPTVKPLALMRWLVRLVTPEGGVVLDPFAGSGTTLEAAHLEGFEAIGVELTPDYWPLIDARIARAVETRAKGGN